MTEDSSWISPLSVLKKLASFQGDFMPSPGLPCPALAQSPDSEHLPGNRVLLAMTQLAHLQTDCNAPHSQHLLYLDGQALEPLKKVTAGSGTVLSTCKTQAASATLDQDQQKQLSHSVLKATRTYPRDSSSVSATHWSNSIHTFAVPAKTTPQPLHPLLVQAGW